MTINQVVAAARSRELVRNVVHPQLASLVTMVGRDDELDRLRQRFLAGASPQVLAGMGGVGKTSLARAYAQRHRHDYGLIWWVRAEDPSALDAELRSLLDILLPAGEAAQVRDARAVAYAMLAERPDPWLLVLDNVADAATAQSLLPPGGHVLITSRATTWPTREIIRPLDPEAAIDLLVTLSGDPDRVSAAVLAEELAGLPLALSQAASFAQTNALDLATYLRLYQSRAAELHAEGRPADYPHTVATTWHLAIEHLSPEARRLLNLFAFFAPDAIPVPLLFAGTDELARHRAVGELHRYSLITPAAHGAVSIHRLVQAVTREGLTDSWPGEALSLISAVIPARPVTAAKLAAWELLHTHVHALLEHLPPEGRSTLTFRNQMAEWPGNAGDPATSHRLYGNLHQVCAQVLGEEHPDTLTAAHNAAHWAGFAVNPATARDRLAELLIVRERVLGPEHPDTLTNRYGLYRWTGDAGDAVSARKGLAALVPVRARVLGRDHLDTLEAMVEAVYWLGHGGDPLGAKAQFEQLLPTFVRVLGDTHPGTLRLRHDLAEWTGEAGDLTRARDLFAELLPLRAQVLGAEHVRTLQTRHELAYWTGEAGDVDASRDMFADLLEVRTRVLGADHLDTLGTLHDLAYRIGQAGEPDRARDMLADLIPRHQQLTGAAHRDTLTMRHNHAHWVGEAGDPVLARDLLAALLPERSGKLGPEHHQILTTRQNLAHWTAVAGDPATAVAQLTELLAIRERVLGPDHVDTRLTRDELARWT